MKRHLQSDIKKIVIVSVLLISLSCNNSDHEIQSKINSKDSADKIASIQNDDSKMNEAILMAKNSFSDFLNAFKSNCANCRDFSVKVRFDYGEGNGEHIWIINLYLKGDKLFGQINNEPENIDRVKLGDTIEVKRDSLSDWMYVKNDQLIGGFTLKVLYNRMNDAEKKQLENDLGAKIK